MNIKLGDLCKIQAGGTPSRSKQEYWNKGEIPWVKIGDIESKYLNKTSEFITDEGLKNSSAKKIEKGSILYTIFATLGEVCINNIDVTTNQAIAGITLKDDKVYIDYLYYFLKSLKNYVNAIGRGVAQNNINLTLLRGFDVPVPDKNRQLIIAQSLSNIEKMINNKKQQLSEYDQLIKSRFVELFGDPESNTKKYPMVNLSDIAQYFNGLTYSPENVSDEGIIVLRSSNIQNSKLDFNDLVRVRLNVKESKMVKENDILMCSRNGSAKLVGKVALIDNLPERMAFGAFMMIIRSEYYAYLMSYFQMDAFRRQITTGATTTINQITSRMLDNVKLPLPEKNEVKKFELLVKQVDKLKFEDDFYQ